MSLESKEDFTRLLHDLTHNLKEEARQAEARYNQHSDRQSIAAQRSDAYSVGLERAVEMIQ